MTQPAEVKSSSETPTVLVFDSGVGGLSILQSIQRFNPDWNFIYASDNAGFPYGTKPEGELVERVNTVLKALTEHDHPDIIVVACNTASTVALPKVRSHFANPVVGVVPAIKPAARLSTSKTIGLLATPGTVTRDYTKQLINEFASHCQVIPVGSSELVDIAEKKLQGTPPDTEALADILEPFFEVRTLDTIVLACTHFPLLAKELEQASPRKVNWVDSGEAIARRVEALLADHPYYQQGQPQHVQQRQLSTSEPHPGERFQTVLTAPPHPGLSKSLHRLGCESIEVITIEEK